MCFAIGKRIVEHEQKGEKRATYGKQVLELLAQAMTAEFGRGFSRRNLELMRRFYILYSSRVSQSLIPQSLTAELAAAPDKNNKAQSLTAQLPECCV
jgi:hypothetical protein